MLTLAFLDLGFDFVFSLKTQKSPNEAACHLP